PTVTLKAGRVTGPPMLRFCAADVSSSTRSARTAAGMLTTRSPLVVEVLMRQNSRWEARLPSAVVMLKMRRTVRAYVGCEPISGTEMVPVVVTCEAHVPSRLMAAGGASGVGVGGASGVGVGGASGVGVGGASGVGVGGASETLQVPALTWIG